MIKDNPKLTKYFLFFSIIISIGYSYLTYDNPVSQTLSSIRLFILVDTIAAIIIGLFGVYLCRKYNINQEIIIDLEDKDYFEYLEGFFKFYLSFIPLLGILFMIVTFLGVYHIESMFIILALFNFIDYFLFKAPILDMIYLIFKLATYYNQ